MRSLNSKDRVVVSGIRPSGRPHLGNYFGAIRQHLDLHKDYESYYFIADYHALTTIDDSEALREFTYDVALDYLALGFDPDEAALFVQSDVPEVTELNLILSNLIPVNRLEDGVSYKEEIKMGMTPNSGLLNYPVLQAADILLYGGNIVPVGEDQKQNIQIARFLARKFNEKFCSGENKLFSIPEDYILDEAETVPGIDGQKMSKSYDNDIEIFSEGEDLKSRVMSIVTDSTPLEEPKDPEPCTVFSLIKLFSDSNKTQSIRENYLEGGYGYGHAKRELLGLIKEYFYEARERRKELKKRPDYVRDVLRNGKKKAREKARKMMNKVRDITGLNLIS